MKKSSQLMGACGLDCQPCDIRQATSDSGVARSISDWFKKQRGEEVKPEDIHCAGCKGDRAKHWSADCWILECCVDKKGLGFCYECQTFPCDKLNEWSRKDERYGHALGRLKKMKRNEGDTP